MIATKQNLRSLTNGLPSRTDVCTRRKRTCGPQGGSPGLGPIRDIAAEVGDSGIALSPNVKTPCSPCAIVHFSRQPSHGGGIMPVTIGRRELVTALGSVAVWPRVARAQQPKVPTIGALVIGNISPEELWRELRQGLRDVGYI